VIRLEIWAQGSGINGFGVQETGGGYLFFTMYEIHEMNEWMDGWMEIIYKTTQPIDYSKKGSYM
jgi:hypothetical protein